MFDQVDRRNFAILQETKLPDVDEGVFAGSGEDQLLGDGGDGVDATAMALDLSQETKVLGVKDLDQTVLEADNENGLKADDDLDELIFEVFQGFDYL